MMFAAHVWLYSRAFSFLPSFGQLHIVDSVDLCRSRSNMSAIQCVFQLNWRNRAIDNQKHYHDGLSLHSGNFVLRTPGLF